MSQLLVNRSAIITGGGQGLGLAIASAFAANGAKSLLVGRDEAKLDKGVEHVQGMGGIATSMACDLTESGTADNVVARALDEFNGLDILVNSAGVFLWKDFLQVSEDGWRSTIETNLSAPFFLSQAAARAMIELERGGSIVNIASIHGTVADPNLVPHCASKSGLISISQAMANALRPMGIRVNAVSPGAIAPDTVDTQGSAPSEKVTQADVANVVAYLASDFARSVTGANVETFGSTHVAIRA